MKIKPFALYTCSLALSGVAAAQATVPFASAGWKDFGTTNVTGVTGNFLPGWTSLTASPDLGNNLFFIPTTSLSGAANDAAIWMNAFDLSSPSGVSNESVRLSLDGFSIGQVYQIDFSATLTQVTAAGWVGNNHALDVALTGADITTFSTSVLNDPIDADGMNTWAAQSIVFTALSTAITFDFGSNPAVDPSGSATRYGFDGMELRPVPTPSTLGVLSLCGLAAIRRRR
jgi:hypothetical protein